MIVLCYCAAFKFYYVLSVKPQPSLVFQSYFLMRVFNNIHFFIFATLMCVIYIHIFQYLVTWIDIPFLGTIYQIFILYYI